jgi:uncharacterized membrane protein
VSSSIREWLNLGTRWFHVFAGIMWVGQTYYFTWLDGQFAKRDKMAPADQAPASVWMVHSGGFYTVDKRKSLAVVPGEVHWFRWEALMTWASGMALLLLAYYFGGGLIDADVADIPLGWAIAIGLAILALGWFAYDLSVRSPLGKSGTAFAFFSFIMTAAASWGLIHIFSGRAAYIHLGAMFGTIMAANVWLRILPAQRKMIAAAASGATFDSSLSAQAKLRSKHNTFMAVPVVFIMLSNHYPVATYGNRYSWEVLVGLVLTGWAAAGLVRRA